MSAEQSLFYELENAIKSPRYQNSTNNLNPKSSSLKLESSRQNLEKELGNSKNVFDIIINIISDIHMHAMRYGNPTTNNLIYGRVVLPDDVNDTLYNKLHAKDLLELYKKEGRKVGGSGILLQ
jgi:hypothetical protein